MTDEFKPLTKDKAAEYNNYHYVDVRSAVLGCYEHLKYIHKKNYRKEALLFEYRSWFPVFFEEEEVVG